jgi:hypothetical protein
VEKLLTPHPVVALVPDVNSADFEPWMEVQSRNLLRRQLSREQVCAIRKLAARQFLEIAVPF